MALRRKCRVLSSAVGRWVQHMRRSPPARLHIPEVARHAPKNDNRRPWAEGEADGAGPEAVGG